MNVFERPRKIFGEPVNAVYIRRNKRESWSDFSLSDDMDVCKKQASAIERHGWLAKIVNTEGSVVYVTEIPRKPKRALVSEDELDKRWIEFSGAVLRLAKKDYIAALRDKHDREKNVARCERFFRSDLGRTLALGKQEYIIEQCRKIARSERVDNDD